MSRSIRSPHKRCWHAMTIVCRAYHVENLAERAREALRVEPVQLLKPGVERAWLDLYFQKRLDAKRAAAMVQQWPEVRGCWLHVVKPRDWTVVWQRHFKPLRVGKRLLIWPVWEKTTSAPPNRRVVRIEPGLSFGTGDHFTTRFCLETVEQLCRMDPPGSLLDAGCGSGIIAIAAAKLGVRRVVALDHDPQAVAQAKVNVRRNRVGNRVCLREGDLLACSLRGCFEVICANLYGDLLIRLAPMFCRCARRSLVLSGVRESEAETVVEAYLRLGASQIGRDGDGEWAGLILTPPPVARSRPVRRVRR